MTAADYEEALQNFLDDEQTFSRAVIDSGVLSNHGGYLCVELFTNGTYKLRNELDGSGRTGRVLGVPYLNDEDYRDLCNQAGSSDPEELVKEMIGDGWPLGDIRGRLENALAESDVVYE